jgi:hypothetical protein
MSRPQTCALKMSKIQRPHVKKTAAFFEEESLQRIAEAVGHQSGAPQRPIVRLAADVR